MKVLEKIRKKIDKTDLKIQKQLTKRLKLIEKIKKLKEKNNIKITDTKRENEILNKIKNPQIQKIYKTIIAVSKNLQK